VAAERTRKLASKHLKIRRNVFIMAGESLAAAEERRLSKAEGDIWRS
jgi:hypothetical protein